MAKYFLRQELKKLKEGFLCVGGLDEAGRGCLAGPLSVAIVVFNDELKKIRGLNDSKVLNAKKRLELFRLISKSCTFKHKFICAEVIDRLGLTESQTRAMNEMINELISEGIPIDFAFMDGKQKWKLQVESKSIVKGDQKLKSIAAASIIAKVKRDLHMKEQDKIFPLYGFRKHVGYGTKEHVKALAEFGVSPIHRLSYAPVKQALENKAANL